MTSNNLVKTILILLVAKLSGTVNITAYNFENILSTTTFALKGSEKCDLSTVNQIIVEKGALVYTELGHTKLKYCMYKAAYTVTAMKKVTGGMTPVFYQLNLRLFQYFTQLPQNCAERSGRVRRFSYRDLLILSFRWRKKPWRNFLIAIQILSIRGRSLEHL